MTTGRRTETGAYRVATAALAAARPRSIARRRFIGRVMLVLASLGTALAILPLLLILWHLFQQGAGALHLSVFTELPAPVGETGGGMAATLDPTKSQRLIRSLEIIERSGKSVTELQALGKMQRSSLRFLTYGMEIPRALLYDRINRRSDEMMQAGLFHEAEVLYHKYRDLISERRTGALQSVGYQELFRHFQGVIELPEAVRLIQQHTRNYAKRQLTFFRNRLTVNWVAAPENRSDVEKLTAALEKLLLNDRSVR